MLLGSERLAGVRGRRLAALVAARRSRLQWTGHSRRRRRPTIRVLVRDRLRPEPRDRRQHKVTQPVIERPK